MQIFSKNISVFIFFEKKLQKNLQDINNHYNFAS